MNAAAGLFIAGQTFPGARVCLSHPNGAMMEVAQRHSVYQASMERLGHQLWGPRTIEMRWRVGPYMFEEVVADSWPHQEHNSYIELGRQMFSSWSKDPAHWQPLTCTHKYFGYGMAKSKAGIWYGTIIMAD